MAKTDPVEIVVDIIDQFSDDLAELRAQLEQIDAMDINIDFDIFGDAEIEQIIARLRSVPNHQSVIFRAQMIGLGRVRSQIASTQAQAALPAPGGDMFGTPPALPAPPDADFPGGGQRGPNVVSGRQLRKLSRSFGGTLGILKKITPNIMMVWNAMAAMIPVFVSLAAAAIGLAGAFAALGTAAVAIVGAGLLGWGDTFGESLDNLTDKAEQLGSRLFDVMQPAAQTFQPIMEDWMEGAPRQIEQLVGPMQDLAVFSDTLAAGGAGFIDWLDRAITSMVAMEDQIEQMAMRFGDIAGSFIIEFMENMTQFAYENQTALIRLAGALRELFGSLLDVSIVVASTLATLSPVIEIIAFLASLLNTDLGRAIVTAIGTLLLLNSVLGLVFSSVAALNGIFTLLAFNSLHKTATYILSSYIPAMHGAIAATMQWVASLSALRAALLTTGIGAALVIGGFALNEAYGSNAGNVPSNNNSGSGSGNTYIQVDGDVGDRELERIIDATKGTTRQEMSIQEDMEG